jgi:ribose transport system substrate-binding protein
VKRTLSCITPLIAALFVVCICSTSIHAAKYVIGYSAPGLIDQFQLDIVEGMREIAKSNDADLIVIDSRNDVAKQIGDIEDLIARKVNLIVVCPNDEHGIVPAVERANRLNVPVITVDRSAAGGIVVSHCGLDNYALGFKAAEFICERIGGKGQVAMVSGTAGMSVVAKDEAGFRDGLKKYPGVQLVATRNADWDKAKAMSVTEDILTRYPDIKGFFAHNDTMIVGVVEALKARKLTGKVVTIGIGGYDDGREAISAGYLTASIGLSAVEGGKATMKLALDVLSGKAVPKSSPWPVTLVTLAGEDSLSLLNLN